MGILRRFKPWLYQTGDSKGRDFEGWFFKCSVPGGPALSVIPGISHRRDAAHSFVQMIDGSSGRTAYFRYPVDAFAATDEPFSVRVGTSVFSQSGMEINLENDDWYVWGSVRFGPWIPYPSGFFKAGIMGPFGIPGFLECYHGLVSAWHSVDGSLEMVSRNGLEGHDDWQFAGGTGYIEKDWGVSFPSSYLWLQANDFELRGLSLFCSLAAIPLKGMDFSGHIATVWVPGTELPAGVASGTKPEAELAGRAALGTEPGTELPSGAALPGGPPDTSVVGRPSRQVRTSPGRFVTFATWNGSRVEALEVAEGNAKVVLRRRGWQLEIHARAQKPGVLKAPDSGGMDRLVKESLEARISFVLSRRGKVLARGESPSGGFERGGTPEALLAWFKNPGKQAGVASG